MRIRFEKRREPSKLMQAVTPVVAVLLTMVIGAVIFEAIGYDGPRAVKEIFFTPHYGLLQMAGRRAAGCAADIDRARPLHGQSRQGLEHRRRGPVSSSVRSPARASHISDRESRRALGLLPLMVLAGIVGGALWAAIPAFLKTRFRVNEILSSLMLVYVALQLLNYLVTGPWKDPNGHNFPQSAPFTAWQSAAARCCGERRSRRACSSHSR